MKEPVDHIQRPLPSWRAVEVLSECGKVDVARIISRREFYDRVKDQGQQRAAMSVCMTCWSTAQRWSGGHGAATQEQALERFVDPWKFDPAEVIRRDEFRGREMLNRELRVLSMLVEAHRGEFDQALAGIDETVSMDDLRSARRRRRRGA